MAFPFAAIGPIVSALSGISAANSQNALLGAQINETRRSNRAAEKMAKSSRTDALGNTLRYVDGQGWTTDVTPIVRAILDGQSREQLATLREDAPRARAASVRKDRRSISADEEYRELFDRRRYGNDKTEKEIQAEEILAAASVNRGGPPAAMLAAAIRSGDPKAMQDASNAARVTTPRTSEVVANARKQGTQRYVTEKGARDQLFYNELGQLGNAASATDAAQPYMADINGQMTGRADQSLQQLIQVIQQGGAQTSAALGNAAANWKTPDLSGIFTGAQGIADAPRVAQQEALARALQEAQLDQMKTQTAKLRSTF